MAMPTWVSSYLEDRNLKHTVRHHAPTYTGQELAQAEHISGNNVAKVVVSVDDGNPKLLVLPASRNVDFRKARTALKSRHLRLAREDEIKDMFPDCEVGAIPPLDHWKNVPVYVDQDAFKKECLIFQAGSHEDAVLLSYEDWFRAVNPRVAKFSTPIRVVRKAWVDRSAALSGVGMIFAVAALSAIALYLFWQFLTGWVVSYGTALGPSGFALAAGVILLGGFSPLIMAAAMWIISVVILPLCALAAFRATF